ncbi:unnamed protein product, partial [Meganyctiphanes norvegica]
MLILVEFCCFGNILDYMRRHRRTFLNQINPDMDTFSIITRSQDKNTNSDGSANNNAVYITAGRVPCTNISTEGCLLHLSDKDSSIVASETEPPTTTTSTGIVQKSYQPLLDSNGTNFTSIQHSNKYSLRDSEMTCITLVSDTHNMEMPNLPQEAPNNSPPVSLCSRDLLCWSFQIARAMDYLQARK